MNYTSYIDSCQGLGHLPNFLGKKNPSFKPFEQLLDYRFFKALAWTDQNFRQPAIGVLLSLIITKAIMYMAVI